MTNDPFRDPATPLGPEQAELRKLTLKTIEADPRGLDMGNWERRKQPNQHFCGTTRCVAGWAQYLARGAVYADGDKALGIPPVDRDAIGLLGLTAAEYGAGDLGPHALDTVHDGALFYLTEDEALERLRELARAEAG
jgi:hypothetical protein